MNNARLAGWLGRAWSSPGWRLFFFGIAYFLLGQIGAPLSQWDSPYISFWLPGGFYLGALLLSPTNEWPRLMMVAFVANALTDLFLGAYPSTLFFFSCANTIQAGCGAWLVRRYVSPLPKLVTLRQFAGLLGFAGLLATMLGGLIGAATMRLSGMSPSFLWSWENWWSGNAMAILLVTSCMLIWHDRPNFEQLKAIPCGKKIEGVLLFAGLIASTWYLVGLDQGIETPYKERLLPLMLWAGLRFGLRGATAASLTLGVVTGFCASHYMKGLSPELRQDGEYVPVLQVFVAIAASVALIPAIVLAQRNRKMVELKESQERFQILTQAAVEGIFISDNGRILDASEQASALLGYDRVEEIIGRNLAEFIGPETRQLKMEAIEEMREAFQEHELIRKDGGRITAEVRGKMLRVGGRHLRLSVVRDITERKRAEAALRREREFSRGLIQSSPDGIMAFDRSFRFTVWNPGMERILGLRQADCLGRPIFEMLPFLRETGEEARFKAALAGEMVLARERPFRVPQSGKSGFYEGIYGPLRGESGDILGGVAMLRDITDRKLAEEKLFASMKELADLKSAIDGHTIVAVTEPAGRITEVNDKFCAICGYAREELVGRHYEEINLLVAPRSVRRRIQAGIGRMKVWQGEMACQAKQGRDFWLESTVVPFIGPAGKPLQFIAISTDITERKRVEAEVRRRENRFRSLIENALDLITVLDAGAVITYQSPSSVRVLGYQPSEMLRRNAFEFLHPEDVAAARISIGKVLARPQVPVTSNLRVNHRDGSTRFFAVVGRAVTSESGATEIILNSRDITESAKLEEQLRQSQKMDAIGRLSGGVAHDFNNMLNIILGHVSLLEMDAALTPVQGEWLADIRNSADRAAHLTRQLLAFSRRQAMQLRVLDLNGVVTQMSSMLQRILGEDIQMRIVHAPGQLVVQADASLLEQALLNLAVNSRDAMPRGGRLIIETAAIDLTEEQSRTLPQSKPGSHVCLSVADNGSGIAPELLPKIFEPFFTTKDVGRGTGLGLATVYGIVHQHQGWISVASEVGKGSIFRIFLPRVMEEPAAVTARPLMSQADCGDETVLLVEDEPTLRKLGQTLLKRFGYTVILASSGVEALEAWKKHRDEIDLLLTDLVMPDGLSGFDLSQLMLLDRPDLPVIFTSGYAPETLGGKLTLEEGVNFLAKPFSPAGLARIIRLNLPARPRLPDPPEEFPV